MRPSDRLPAARSPELETESPLIIVTVRWSLLTERNTPTRPGFNRRRDWQEWSA
jgi:hypothetical protein